MNRRIWHYQMSKLRFCQHGKGPQSPGPTEIQMQLENCNYSENKINKKQTDQSNSLKKIMGFYIKLDATVLILFLFYLLSFPIFSNFLKFSFLIGLITHTHTQSNSVNRLRPENLRMKLNVLEQMLRGRLSVEPHNRIE